MARGAAGSRLDASAARLHAPGSVPMERRASLPREEAGSSGDPAVDWLHAQANRALREGRIDDAVPFLEKAAQVARDAIALGEIHVLLGRILAHREAWARSTHHFRLATEADPGRADAWHDLGLAHAQQENTRAAAEAFARAAELSPDDPEILRALGVALAALGVDGEADRWLRRAGEMAPDDLAVLESLATHHLKMGRFSECGLLIQRAVQLAPDNPLVRRLAKETSYLVELAAGAREPAPPAQRRVMRVLLAGAAGEVERMVVERMTEDGFAAVQITNACDAWRDYVQIRSPRIRSVAEHAAAVQFLIARMDFVDGSARDLVAGRYGVDARVLSRIHGEIVEALDASVFDPRYSTQPHPAGQVTDQADESGLVPEEVFQALLEDEYREYEGSYDRSGTTIPRLDRQEFEDASVEYGSLLTREMMGLTLGKRDRMRKRELERVLLVT